MTDWSTVFDAKKEFALRPFGFQIISQEQFQQKAIELSDQGRFELIHFGCGKEKLPLPIFQPIRVDIDKTVNPDFNSLEEIPKVIRSSVSVLYANNVIEHLDLEEIKTLFKWCVDEKISIVFNAPNAWASYGVYANDYTHKTFLSFRAFAGLLREAGFGEIQIFRVHDGNHSRLRDRIADIIGIDYVQGIAIIAKVKR